MTSRSILTVFVAVVVVGAGGCVEVANPQPTKPAAKSTPTPTALWANHQVDTFLSGAPDTLPILSEQLLAIATLEGGDPDAALPMDLRSDEMDSIWQRVREGHDTAWVRGGMIRNGRAQFVHTLMMLHVQKKAPTLFGEVPGAFDDEARRWPAWIDAHKAQLGMN